MINITKPIIENEEISAVTEVLKSGQLAMGKIVEDFEQRFAQYIGVSHAIAVTNGTVALHLALLAAGITKNDEVITSPFSFIASANCVLYVGGIPVFTDVNLNDFCLDTSQIEKLITSKTKAILPVHLYGQMCDMDTILQIANKHNLVVIEDACQAHGALYKGKKAGSLGKAGCFSFYATKNMTCGEGGMITTNDDNLFEKLKLLRNHGQKIRYEHEILGYNFRMTNINAAIGREQLKKLDGLNDKRLANANYLTEELSGIKGIICPEIMPHRNHIFHQYTILVQSPFPYTRDQLMENLTNEGVSCGIYYPILIPDQVSFKNVPVIKQKYPRASLLTKQVLSLPIHPLLCKNDLDYIINVIRAIK